MLDPLSPPLPMAWLVTLLMFSGFFVLVEPAPYDLLAVGLVAFYFTNGLRLPAIFMLPLALLLVIVLANLLSIVLADTKAPGYELLGFARYVSVSFYLILTTLLFAGLMYSYPDTFLSAMWSGYTAAGIIACLLGIYGFFDLGPGAEALTGADRAKGLFKDPNVFGPFLVPLILHHSLTILKHNNGLSIGSLLLRLAILALLILGLFLSFSRGAWGNMALAFGAACCLLFFSYSSWRERLRLSLVLGAGLLMLLVSLAYTVSRPELQYMVSERVNLVNSYDVNERGRFATQAKMIPDIINYPQGWGPNRLTPSITQPPHNVHLKMFAEYGWLGGIAWLFLCGLTLVAGLDACMRRSPYQLTAITFFSSVLAITVEGFIIDTLHWRHYFALLGGLWGTIALVANYRPLNVNILEQSSNKL